MRAYNVSLNLSKRHFFFSNPCVQKSLCMYLYIYPSDSLPSIDTLSHSKIHPLPITRVAMATFMLFWRSSTGRKLNFLGSCDMPKSEQSGVNKVFEPLMTDLKVLEERGIMISDGSVVRATLVAISGDNLGSHSIGGFLENFSRADHFCRYCEIDRDTFVNEPHLSGTTRTAQLYQSHLDDLKTSDTNSVCGIKSDSPFNQLAHFHVCQPGLPPCLGHDLFEGIVSYDLALFIGHLVKEKHFTYLQLNRCKNQFKYQGNDGIDKPADLSPGSERLSGHAAQNWCLLRLVPLLVGDRIKHPYDNEVWQLILQLREIVELVCAPAITAGQVAYLKVIIEEYIYDRKKLFPDHPLKPKHHYLCHYPELIIHFGPLIRLWTLRFESKHTFFKQCARKLHNFKSLCKTLAERHQLLQAYLSAGNLFPPHIQVEKGTEFYVNDYNDRIRASVASYEFESQSAVACNNVTVKGTVYRKGMFVLLGNNDEELYVGKINLIIVLHDSVHFVTEKHTFRKLRDMGIYCELGAAREDYVCIKHEDLLDYHPLPAYKVHDLSLIAPHHSFSEAV